MAVQLSPSDVLAMTSVEVSAFDISVASELIDTQTDYTPDEHNTVRGIDTDSVRMAWAVVSARVHSAAGQASGLAVTSETQGDYTYAESVTLALHERFADLTDGLPRELLNMPKAVWAHI